MNKLSSILLLALVTFSAKADIEAGAEASLIIGGILEGALEAEMTNLNTCIFDAEKFALDIYNAVLDFEEETYEGVSKGIMEIGVAVT